MLKYSTSWQDIHQDLPYINEPSIYKSIQNCYSWTKITNQIIELKAILSKNAEECSNIYFLKMSDEISVGRKNEWFTEYFVWLLKTQNKVSIDILELPCVDEPKLNSHSEEDSNLQELVVQAPLQHQ